MDSGYSVDETVVNLLAIRAVAVAGGADLRHALHAAAELPGCGTRALADD